MKYWLLLVGMILTESLATLFLKMSDGFSHLLYSAGAFVGYLSVLFLFSFILKVIPASVAYAVWAGCGTLLVALAGWLWFGESLGKSDIVGIGLIIFGVILLNRPPCPYEMMTAGMIYPSVIRSYQPRLHYTGNDIKVISS